MLGADEQNPECVICYMNYEETDEVVRLKCNEKHYFHEKCIEQWIKQGKNTCPVCRETIDPSVAIDN
jgi:E3 ubiquitin-protein ligase DOA10